MKFPVHKHSYWLTSGEFELATHAHLPESVTASTAVLVCNTVGHEAIHAYRSMLRLGDAIAAAGLAAFRFDFAGSGNSSGDADAADLVAAWQANIEDQVRDLRERWGFERIVVVAKGGATLIDLTTGGSTELPEPEDAGLEIVSERSYGETRILILRDAAHSPLGADEAAQ